MKFIQIVTQYVEGGYHRGQDSEGKTINHPAETAVYAAEPFDKEALETVMKLAAQIPGKFNPGVIIGEGMLEKINRQPSRVVGQLFEIVEDGSVQAKAPRAKKNGKK